MWEKEICHSVLKETLRGHFENKEEERMKQEPKEPKNAIISKSILIFKTNAKSMKV